MTSPMLTTPEGDLLTRSAVHAALGEPVRLAIVESLLLSDLTPQDIVNGMNIRSNLLAHHLNVLENAGLISRTRSEGDGRRRYLRISSDAPTVRLRIRSLEATRVLFVCSDGGGRSQLAGRLFADRSSVEVMSAGVNPATSIGSGLKDAADRLGITELESSPTAVSDLTSTPDLVITLCDVVRESPELPVDSSTPLLHWSLPTPSPESSSDHEAIATDLTGRLDRLVAALDPSVTEIA